MAKLPPVEELFNKIEAAAWGGYISTYGHLAKRIETNLRQTAGISHAEYEVLLRLAIQDDRRLRINALAASSVLTHSGTSRLIDRLEGAGFVERVGADEDKRGSYVLLTTQGHDQFMQIARKHTAFVREIFLDHFSKAELETMGSLWTRLDTNDRPDDNRR